MIFNCSDTYKHDLQDQVSNSLLAQRCALLVEHLLQQLRVFLWDQLILVGVTCRCNSGGEPWRQSIIVQPYS
jgi:hypothetical protein